VRTSLFREKVLWKKLGVTQFLTIPARTKEQFQLLYSFANKMRIMSQSVDVNTNILRN
jgi:hypothetical protein